MNILFTGRGGAGSWQIRGEQLARDIDEAIALPQASYGDIVDCDLVMAVKRLPLDLVRHVRSAKKRWVWDVVDFYPQPLCTHWAREEAIRWVKQQIAQANPTAVVWPNQRMRDDCDDGRPGLVLYHHHRPGLDAITVAPKLRHVAYEGAAPYLGQWAAALASACRVHGAKFLLNPSSMRVADAVVAVRDTPFAGYAQTHWKSNVKLANAQALGAVFVGQRECGYQETSTGAELWVDSAKDLPAALEALASQEFRAGMQAKALAGAYPVRQAAADLERFLHAL
jgi:hypothetical protein